MSIINISREIVMLLCKFSHMDISVVPQTSFRKRRYTVGMGRQRKKRGEEKTRK